jgi:hypothetical protein
LNPKETLVEFSEDSSVDPTNWTLVSLIVLKDKANRNNPRLTATTEKENIQCSCGVDGRA